MGDYVIVIDTAKKVVLRVGKDVRNMPAHWVVMDSADASAIV